MESLVRQTTDRAQFEIIVVKNYNDSDIDAYLRGAGARPVLCTDVPYSQKLLAGFAAARGKVLLFLEDDDTYEPNRMRIILDAFGSISDLGFYRNSLTFIDGEGNPLGLSWRQATIEKPLFMGDGQKEALVRQLVHRDPDFNCSSMAVHREVFEHCLPYLSRSIGPSGAADILLFFAALVSDRSIFIDGRPLTRYRIHGGNASQISTSATASLDRESQRLATSLRHILDHNRITRELVAESRRPFALRLINARILVNRLQIAYTDRSSTRADVALLLPSLVRSLDTFPVRNSLLTVLLGPLYIAFPSLARRAWGHAASSAHRPAG